jgi:hypothetical protein
VPDDSFELRLTPHTSHTSYGSLSCFTRQSSTASWTLRRKDYGLSHANVGLGIISNHRNDLRDHVPGTPHHHNIPDRDTQSLNLIDIV